MASFSSHKIGIERYSDPYRLRLFDIWEQSVLATHHFLAQDDFQSIKAIVQTIDFNTIEVYCLMQGDNMLGFIGTVGDKIEMLFLHPDAIGQGYGLQLVRYAIEHLSATKVDVNEENTSAVRFFERCGFVTYQRTELDDLGMQYPLLRMKLK